jgi:uncharacterized protein YraI
MSHLPKLIAGGIAAATLLLGTAAAIASPGAATGSVHVRTGPGTSYGVVDTLYRGEDVDIGSCTGGWCHITHSGPDGWVAANYLSGDTAEISEPQSYYYSPPVYDEEPIYDDQPYYDEPAPVFINPPYFQHRHFDHHPGRQHMPGVGNTPPAGGFTPPGNGNVFRHRDHMMGVGSNNTPGNGFVHNRSFTRSSGAGLSCATDPALCAGRSATIGSNQAVQSGSGAGANPGHRRNNN